MIGANGLTQEQLEEDTKCTIRFGRGECQKTFTAFHKHFLLSDLFFFFFLLHPTDKGLTFRSVMLIGSKPSIE